MGFTEVKVENKFFVDAVSPEKRGTCVKVSDMYGLKACRTVIGDAKIHDMNFGFLSTELAKLHTKAYEPKWYVTWQEDLPFDNGGGLVDYVEWYSVDWSGILNNNRNLVSNNANYIPRVNAAMTQNLAKVFTYQVAYDLRFVELEKMKKEKLQKSIQDIYNDAILAGWDLFVQDVAYTGMQGVTGLFNDAKVLVNVIDNNGTTGSGFEGLTDDVVVAAINGIFATYLSESNLNVTILPDRILVPMFVMNDLVSRFSALYSNSLYDFIIDHNLAKAQAKGKNFSLEIVGRDGLDTLGTAGKGRIVAYKKDKDFVRIDIPYDMQHYITLPNIERMAYTSAFLGQVSQVQLPYNTDANEFGIVSYWDFTH